MGCAACAAACCGGKRPSTSVCARLACGAARSSGTGAFPVNCTCCGGSSDFDADLMSGSASSREGFGTDWVNATSAAGAASGATVSGAVTTGKAMARSVSTSGSRPLCALSGSAGNGESAAAGMSNRSNIVVKSPSPATWGKPGFEGIGAVVKATSVRIKGNIGSPTESGGLQFCTRKLTDSLRLSVKTEK